jgi:hypothetical protein
MSLFDPHTLGFLGHEKGPEDGRNSTFSCKGVLPRPLRLSLTVGARDGGVQIRSVFPNIICYS